MRVALAFFGFCLKKAIRVFLQDIPSRIHRTYRCRFFLLENYFMKNNDLYYTQVVRLKSD